MNIPLPAYIDPEAWAGFVEMRKASGRTRPFTTRAATLILFELQRIKDAGHCPNAALNQSTMKGWADVWPAKDKQLERKQTVDEFEAGRQKFEEWRNRSPEQKDAANRARLAAVQAIKRVG
jgi:hypothetical protein